jgi:hypothetical protein
MLGTFTASVADGAVLSASPDADATATPCCLTRRRANPRSEPQGRVRIGRVSCARVSTPEDGHGTGRQAIHRRERAELIVTKGGEGALQDGETPLNLKGRAPAAGGAGGEVALGKRYASGDGAIEVLCIAGRGGPALQRGEDGADAAEGAALGRLDGERDKAMRRGLSARVFR